MKILNIISSLLLESESSKGCLMIYFDNSDWNNYIRSYIEESDIYLGDNEEKYGYSDDSHVTVLWGFIDTEKNIDDVQQYCPRVDSVDDITSNKISIFENEDFDVVKYEIQSDKLNKMNSLFKENFKYENSYDTYAPHVTIAYVKKGMGKKYIKKLKNAVKFDPLYYVYSDKNRKNYKFK